MSTLVTYQLEDSIAAITMDDGKVNVMSLHMLTELNAALDQAVADRAVVVLSGREGVFSAGFDLPVLRAGGPESIAMVRAGFELAARMGVFLLLSGDYRVGAAGSYKLTANEVAIGLTMPMTNSG